MLQQRDLLLELLRELVELILGQNVLLLALTDGFALVVEEATALFLRDYLGRIVEEDASRVVGQQVAQPVLSAVVDPLSHPDRVRAGLR